MNEKYLEANLMDDAFFSLIMNDDYACQCLLSIILEKKIISVSTNITQNEIENALGNKAIRCDLYVKDSEGTNYIVEIQKVNNDDMPRRSKYYQNMLGAQMLPKGTDVKYKDLSDTYCIFICDFDPFKKGYFSYVFESYCKCADVNLNDGDIRIFLNTKGIRHDNDNEKLISLLDYLVATTDVNSLKCQELIELHSIVK